MGSTRAGYRRREEVIESSGTLWFVGGFGIVRARDGAGYPRSGSQIRQKSGPFLSLSWIVREKNMTQCLSGQ